jgi:hypothetical protein
MNAIPHQQVFTCIKCHAPCLKEDLSKAGKCKACSRNKLNAKRVFFDGNWFHSQYEANRYAQLQWLQKAGKIGPILLQPPYPIVVAGEYICTYFADFLYEDLTTGETVIEDAKGYNKNPTYLLKKKLVEAIYSGVKIIEV